MSLYKPSKSMNTAALAPELGRHWVKRLARRMGIPTPTARYWIYVKTPAARQEEIRAAIIAECDQLDALIAEVRQRWGEPNEARGTMDGSKNDKDRTPSRIVGKQLKS